MTCYVSKGSGGYSHTLPLEWLLTPSHSVCMGTRGTMSNMKGLFGGLNWRDHCTQSSYSMLICKVAISGVPCKVVLGLMFSIFIADPNN